MTISRTGTTGAPTEAVATSVARSCGTVTAGQLVNITLAGWSPTVNPTITAGTLTQTAGTATIDAAKPISLDRANSGNNGEGSFSYSAQWSCVIDTGGTLTLTAAGFEAGSSLTISNAGAASTLGWGNAASRVESVNGQHTAANAATALSTGNCTSAGEAWFVSGLCLNNGAAVTVTNDASFSAIADNGANGAAQEVLAHADRIVVSGTTDACDWTFTALDGSAYNGQAATLVVYKEAAAAGGQARRSMHQYRQRRI